MMPSLGLENTPENIRGGSRSHGNPGVKTEDNNVNRVLPFLQATSPARPNGATASSAESAPAAAAANEAEDTEKVTFNCPVCKEDFSFDGVEASRKSIADHLQHCGKDDTMPQDGARAGGAGDDDDDMSVESNGAVNGDEPPRSESRMDAVMKERSDEEGPNIYVSLDYPKYKQIMVPYYSRLDGENTHEIGQEVLTVLKAQVAVSGGKLCRASPGRNSFKAASDEVILKSK